MFFFKFFLNKCVICIYTSFDNLKTLTLVSLKNKNKTLNSCGKLLTFAKLILFVLIFKPKYKGIKNIVNFNVIDKIRFKINV